MKMMIVVVLMIVGNGHPAGPSGMAVVVVEGLFVHRPGVQQRLFQPPESILFIKSSSRFKHIF